MYRLNVYDATQKRLKIIFDYFDYEDIYSLLFVYVLS